MDHGNSDVESGRLVTISMQETQGERAETSANSDVAVESGSSMAPHGIPDSRMKQDRGASPAVSYVSMKSDWSMDHPGSFKREVDSSCVVQDQCVKQERVSPAPSCLSMKSDRSMGLPFNFKTEVHYPDSSWIKKERSDCPSISYMSMTSDTSLNPPIDFKRQTWTPELSEFSSTLLTTVHVRCCVCSSTLRDPVSSPCGHSYCKHCINTRWSQPSPTGDYVCPQCEKSYPTRPVLYDNVALTWMLKALQQTGFSPACPTLAQAGPGDVACDICPSFKLRAAKTCLTCSAAYCENHVRQHYTVPALQKHTLAQVNDDTRLSQWEGNSDRMEVIKEEPFVDSESEEHQEIACKKRKKMAVKEEDEMFQHLSKLHLEQSNLMNISIQEKQPRKRTVKGVIAGVPQSIDATELEKNLRGGTILNVRTLTMSKAGVKPFLLEFEGESLPDRIRLGYMSYHVGLYIPKPVRCYNCQRFGHIAANCKQPKRCARCGEDHSYGSCDPEVQPRCCSCGEGHTVAYGGCKVMKRQTEIQRLRTENKISYAEAMRVTRGQCLLIKNKGDLNRSGSSQKGMTDVICVDKKKLVSYVAGVINSTAADAPSKNISKKLHLDVGVALNHLVGMEWEDICDSLTVQSS